jgi:hypothetical protein
MPSWFNWRFRNGAPLPFKVIFGIVIVNLCAEIALIFSMPKWGRPIPDLSHSYPVVLKSRGIYFVQPWIGKYLTVGLWMHFLLIAAAIFLLWRYRSQIQRGI